MTNLSIALVKDKLLKEDEVKKAAYAQQKLSSHRKSKEVKGPKDPSSKLTKVTQVEVPSASEKAKKAPKSSSAKDAGGIPQADFAHTYIDKQDVPPMSKSKNQKSPKGPKVASLKPNQETKMKEIKGAIKGTEGGKEGKSSIPQADFAKTYTDKMPHGDSNLKASADDVPTVKAPKAKDLKGTTRPKAKTKQANFADKDKKKADQIDGSKQGDLPTPSDAPAKATFKKDARGAHNVVESGVVVKLRGKVKARFDFVSEGVLNRMKKNYAAHGYELTFERTKEAAWKTDREFLTRLRESVDAKYNFAPSFQKRARTAALKRFHSLLSTNFNNLYESREEFTGIVREAFKRVEEKAEQKYLASLELFECMVRIEADGEVADLEMVTEATGHEMALRQAKNTVMEQYGLETEIHHIFVDGTKYSDGDVQDWTSTSANVKKK